jgi:uncharacterized protein YyaL (SSP411 family)
MGATNRLAAEPSPYLRQHAANPVDWYPWGDEAQAAARSRQVPILLSVGYAACHWCHVMAHESFEDPAIAAVMNAHYVCVKVDREERPDLDAIYQTVCQMATGQGGWPLTVFLTPDLRPFYVGTYFPPRAGHGRPGFPDLLRALAGAWRDRRDEVLAVAAEWTQHLARHERTPLAAALPDGGHASPREGPEDALARLKAAVDPQFGGFGDAPKFPSAPALSLLLAGGAVLGDRQAIRLAELTLDRMAAGGVRDQLGGAFHRYAVDRAWRVPHFEKMLYDTALLVPVYLDAHVLTGADRHRRVAIAALDDLQRHLRDPAGGFASSLDADSAGGEGAYYTWTPQEVADELGAEDARVACAWLGIGGAGDLDGRSVPYQAETPERLAGRLGRDPDVLGERLEELGRRLSQARDRRPPPARDGKVLAGWNGLALTALCRAHQVAGRASDRTAAEEVATFCLERLRAPDGGLYRRYVDGAVGVDATLDDYAYLAQGLFDLYQTTYHTAWLAAAADLARQAIDRFFDDADGGFYLCGAARPDLIGRPRAQGDEATPAAQSVMVRTLLRLWPFTGDPRMRRTAERVLEASAAAACRHPHGLASLVEAGLWAAPGPVEVAVVAEPADLAQAAEWLSRSARLPLLLSVRTLATPDAAARPAPAITGDADRPVPAWQGRTAGRAGPAAFVCREGVCGPPLHEWQALQAALLQCIAVYKTA